MTRDGGPSAPVWPAERGGWWHAFVCPVHGTELVRESLLTGVFPAGGARCRRGCRVDTPAVRGAWTALAHQACARRLRELAGSEPKLAASLLTEYALTHQALTRLTPESGHEGAQSWMLPGRLFHQALTEAIWAVNFAHAAWTAAEAGADLSALVPFLADLADHAAAGRASLVAQDRFDSNYTAWLTAAGAVCAAAAALAAGDRPGPDPRGDWLGGPHGLYAHVLAGTHPDGWEWEASSYYHGFVLRAYLLALRATAPASWPVEVAERLTAMVAALAAVAGDDSETGRTGAAGLVPALHDGPYAGDHWDLEWGELFTLAGQAVSPTGLPVGDDPLAADWFTGPALPGAAARSVFPDAGLAVVRIPGLRAVLDFGPHGGSHGHLDKLALYLYGQATPFQPDPGQVPYGHAGFRRHYASTAAHPTFRVDGAEQAECAGRLLAAGAGTVTASADAAYPGISASRRLQSGAGYLVDVVSLRDQRADRKGRELALGFRPDVALTVRQLGEVTVTEWGGPDSPETLTGWHLATAPAVLSVRPGPGPADDPQRQRDWLEWTCAEQRVLFCSVFQPAGDGSAVAGVRLDRENDQPVLSVRLTDGSLHHHPLGDL